MGAIGVHASAWPLNKTARGLYYKWEQEKPFGIRGDPYRND